MTKGSSRRRARVESARSESARAERERCLAVAHRLLAGGDYEGAIAPLLDAARLFPSDAEVQNDLGVAYMASQRFPEAITWLRRAIVSLPRIGNTHYNLGLALQHVGDDEAAIAEHRRAVALSPDLAGAHAQLADLLMEKGLRSEAVSAYERASASAPGTSLGSLSKAKALVAENRYAEAEEALRQLVASEASNSLAHVLLGNVLQTVGRFDEAAASFERSIAIAPWRSDAHYGLVSSRRLTEADRPWIARILARLDAEDGQTLSPATAARHRMMLHFAAGKALDDLGDYAHAMRHFGAANEVRRRLYPFHPDAVEERVDELIARFTPVLLADHGAVGRDDATPLLIVGMPRSGTTLLERIVSSHPEVGGCGELDFWNERGPALVKADPQRLAMEADPVGGDYLRVLRRSAPDALRATDKMPFNFFWVGLVHLLFPNARILHCRRNAVDTCLSIHTTPVASSSGFASTLGDLASYYRQYLRLMDHWRAVIPADRLLDVDYEDVVAEPEKTARRVIAFAGLSWDSACLRPEANRDAVRTASSWQARQPIYRSSVERWRRYEPWGGELRELLLPK
jgi:tetratricopeptide (TPR) repeat protein